MITAWSEPALHSDKRLSEWGKLFLCERKQIVLPPLLAPRVSATLGGDPISSRSPELMALMPDGMRPVRSILFDKTYPVGELRLSGPLRMMVPFVREEEEGALDGVRCRDHDGLGKR